MANTPHHETGKIFEFPVRGRSWGQRAAESGGSVVALAPRRVANVSYGAWYHEAALRESDDKSDH